MHTKPKVGVKIRLIRRFRELCSMYRVHQVKKKFLKVFFFLNSTSCPIVTPITAITKVQ